MKRTNVKVATAQGRPNRLLVVLAAAWMILSLAIGGIVSADSSAEATGPAAITGTATQP